MEGIDTTERVAIAAPFASRSHGKLLERPTRHVVAAGTEPARATPSVAPALMIRLG